VKNFGKKFQLKLKTSKFWQSIEILIRYLILKTTELNFIQKKVKF